MDGTMHTNAIEEVTAMRRDVNDTLVFVRVVPVSYTHLTLPTKA